jgi:hypothetical protein
MHASRLQTSTNWSASLGSNRRSNESSRPAVRFDADGTSQASAHGEIGLGGTHARALSACEVSFTRIRMRSRSSAASLEPNLATNLSGCHLRKGEGTS